MNTIVTFGVVLFALIGALLITGGQPSSTARVAAIVAGIAAAFGVIFYPISRTLWSAIDLMIIPLEPGEVDPRFDPAEAIDSTPNE